MTTQLVTKVSAGDLNKQIEQHLKELAEATDKARTSEEMIRYLDFCAKFHQYSAGNIWLILMAKPDASFVAGFQKWKAMGRWVRKWERGIPILAPMLVKEEDDDASERQHLIGFRVVYVYDVSQTDGEPMPPVPNWKSSEKNLGLHKKLIDFANKKGIEVTIESMNGEVQGISMGGKIKLAPEAGTKTLVHEIAHELLHQMNTTELSKEEKEMEAETVGYIVSRCLGIDRLTSPNYLVLHGISAQMIIDDHKNIKTCASEIIEYVLG